MLERDIIPLSHCRIPAMIRIQRTMDAWAVETSARIIDTDGITAHDVADKILLMFG